MSTANSESGSPAGEICNPKLRGRPVDPAKRVSILDAAVAAFFDQGFAAASIEKIAADANVSKVTIYNHFRDKPALFAAAVEHKLEEMRGLFTIDTIDPEQTIRSRLEAIGAAMSDFLSRPEMVQFDRRIAAETERDPKIGRTFLEAGPWRMKAAFAALLAYSVQRGELAIDDPELATEQFVSMCKGIGDLERRYGVQVDGSEDKKRIAGAVDVFLRAYATKTGR